MIAYITWKINRFGGKQHNNAVYNKNYFNIKKDEIKTVIDFLEDNISKQIYEQCLTYRCTHNVKDQPFYNRKEQYFPEDIIKLSNKEIFVDCGAYIGDTIKIFKKKVNNQFEKIVAFEPSEKNCNKLNDMNDITIVTAGAWKENKRLYFKEDGDGSVILNDKDLSIQNFSNMIEGKKIDDCLECKKATYIKMDIEGAELNALMGAENTIRENNPKLAICIYHSAEDMVMIPLYIHNKYPNYKLYVRHHSHRCSETVLYAIPL